MSKRPIRLAVRALIMLEGQLLLVNAYPGAMSDLWCAPGGGVDNGASLIESLQREVMEETGLTISVGTPALINEFHDPRSGFHQVEVFFRCQIVAGQIDPAWCDPERIVTRRRLVTRSEMDQGQIRFKPDSLADVAWGTGAATYDPLEVIIR
ncbi:MAG: NUDIX domain-containing protein [Microgenomates group bacterium]